MQHSDILIIGAGAAGLMAAYELAKAGKKVTILEARGLIGGRIHSTHHFGDLHMAETGAEFIHGHLPVTLQLLKDAGIAYHNAGGEFWHAKDGALSQEEHMIEHWDTFIEQLNALEEDMSINDFLDAYFAGPQYASLRHSVIQFAQGYDTADICRASALALREEWQDEGYESQYRIDEGYGTLTAYLAGQVLQHKGAIHTNMAVKEVHWRSGQATAITANNESFTAPKLIVTIPVNTLQLDTNEKDAITFHPELVEQRAAVQKLGMGAVIKILLQFSEAIWQHPSVQQLANNDMRKLSFILSDQAVPTWWTQYPKDSNLLTGWVGGPAAEEMKDRSDEEILHIAIASLANILALKPSFIQEKLKASHIANWTTVPYIRGSYSYATVETNRARDILTQPVEDTIYFAGEALYDGPAMGTVEAALDSGKKAAEAILH